MTPPNGSSDLWRYISLNDIHLELGATSGTTVSLNDTDVRGLVNIASGTIDLADFYGASAGQDIVLRRVLLLRRTTVFTAGIALVLRGPEAQRRTQTQATTLVELRGYIG